MDKQSEDFLFKYLNNHSPTGFETSGQSPLGQNLLHTNQNLISDYFDEVF